MPDGGKKNTLKIRREKKRRDTADLRAARTVDFVLPPDRVICVTLRNVSFPWHTRVFDYR